MPKFLDWTLSIKPTWAGFVVFLSGSAVAVAGVTTLLVTVLALTNGWALLIVPAAVLYSWYIALTKQDGENDG